MEHIHIFCAIGLIVLSILYHYESIEKINTLFVRKKQSKSILRENVIKEKLDEIIEERVKLSKRNKIEDKLIQAGFDISYTEYIMICIFSGIIMSVVFGTMLSNIMLAILFLVFGFLIPYQIVSFLQNKRLSLLEKQIGAFMQMIIKRYENTRDFYASLKMTGAEFEGEEPMSTEIKRTILEIDLGISVSEALNNMAKRTNNKYMKRFASYYEIVSEIGTDEIRRDLLTQAYKQYEENRQLKRILKKEIAGPVQDAYVMILAVPMFAVYQIITNDEYIYFMTKVTMGKIGTVAIIGTLITVAWFVNAKLGAPLD